MHLWDLSCLQLIYSIFLPDSSSPAPFFPFSPFHTAFFASANGYLSVTFSLNHCMTSSLYLWLHMLIVFLQPFYTPYYFTWSYSVLQLTTSYFSFLYICIPYIIHFCFLSIIWKPISLVYISILSVQVYVTVAMLKYVTATSLDVIITGKRIFNFLISSGFMLIVVHVES